MVPGTTTVEIGTRWFRWKRNCKRAASEGLDIELGRIWSSLTCVGELQRQQLAKLERHESTDVNDLMVFHDEVCEPKLTGADGSVRQPTGTFKMLLQPISEPGFVLWKLEDGHLRPDDEDDVPAVR
ncbi:hypothetical protein RP20_CCG015277 [Aedes albopictus]|nr:hypothetical protein RP20_CCG015277 [Aedes albopictus]